MILYLVVSLSFYQVSSVIKFLLHQVSSFFIFILQNLKYYLRSRNDEMKNHLRFFTDEEIKNLKRFKNLKGFFAFLSRIDNSSSRERKTQHHQYYTFEFLLNTFFFLYSIFCTVLILSEVYEDIQTNVRTSFIPEKIQHFVKEKS